MNTSTIKVGTVAIRYRDSGGPGVPVLLSSGISESLEFFDPQFDALGDKMRLIAWDYPGHGLSDMGDQPYEPDKYARFALSFLDALGVHKAVLVGNSLGGTIAIRMAGLAPERVLGMVLISAAMLGPEVFTPFKLMTLPGLGSIMTRPSGQAVDMQLKAVFHPSYSVSPSLREVARRNTFKPGANKAFLATLRMTLGLRGVHKPVWQKTRDILRHVQCPVLFVHGRQDQVLPHTQSEECAALTPSSVLEILDECGHTAQMEKAHEFNALLSEFVTVVGQELTAPAANSLG